MNNNPQSRRNGSSDSPAGRSLETALQSVEESLRGLCYGQVTIIVQDGVVVQIDRLERKRLR